MNKLRVAVIGCGRISVRHFAAILDSPYADLAACCDIRSERAENAAKQYGCKAYTDYVRLLDEVRPDAVHICLPHYLHSKAAIAAFERGSHVLTEKPMDIDLTSAEKAASYAEKCGLQFGVVMQCRYNDSVRFVKQALDSGKLGKILSARSTLTWARPDSYYLESDWKGTWDKEGGGVVIDQAIHSIDLVNWLIDSEPETVSCSMANRGHTSVQVEDSAEGLITYKNGVKYGFYAMNNYGCNEPIEIRFLCENGKVVFGYDSAEIAYNDGTREQMQSDVQTEAAKDGKPYWGVRHGRQIEQFYKACLGLENLEISGREALKTHRLIMELYRKGGMRK